MDDITRTNKLKAINLSLTNANDEQISDIYNLFINGVKCKEIITTRQTMVEHIIEKLNVIEDKTLDNMYEYANIHKLLDDNGAYYIKVKKREN